MPLPLGAVIELKHVRHGIGGLVVMKNSELLTADNMCGLVMHGNRSITSFQDVEEAITHCKDCRWHPRNSQSEKNLRISHIINVVCADERNEHDDHFCAEGERA